MKNVKKVIATIMVVCMMASLIACGNETKNVRGLTPLYTEVDMKKLPDGIYHVTFDSADVSEANGDLYLNVEVYSDDLYDAVEVQNVKEGDVIIHGGEKEKIEKIAWDENKSSVAFNVDSFDDNIWCLCPSDAGGTYYFDGPDGHHSYTKRGESKVKISKKCVVNDTSQVLIGGNEINLEYDYIVNYINNNNDYYFLNTSVRVENAEIVEVNKWYIP